MMNKSGQGGIADTLTPLQRLSPLNINVLYLYGTNMDAYDDR